MKKLRPIALILATLLLSTLVLASCASKYRDDRPANVITAGITEELKVTGGYLPHDSDFMQFYLPDAVEPVDDYSVVYSVEASNYNEIGVLHVKDGKKLDVVEEAVKGYLDDFRATYEQQAQLYDATEQEKLKDASYKIYGNYVVYMILTDADQEICNTVIEEILKTEETT